MFDRQVDVEPLSSAGSDASVQIADWNVLPDTPLVGNGPVAETVTVTLTQAPGEGNTATQCTVLNDLSSW